jgi:hypothetical protein
MKTATSYAHEETLYEKDSESILTPFKEGTSIETIRDFYMSEKLYESAIRVFEKLLVYGLENLFYQTKLERSRARLIQRQTNY